MKKPTRTTMPQWWLLLLSTCLASLLLLFFLSFTATTKLIPASLTAGDSSGGGGGGGGGFAGHLPRPPRLAYLISGSKGSSQKLRRVLRAVYHPLNVSLLHLNRKVLVVELAKFVRPEAALVRFDNVRFVGNADLVTYKGPTMVASTLHAVANLLKLGKPCDWFINLSSSDYLLMPQDGLTEHGP